MVKKETEGLEYIRNVFTGLPTERKDYVLSVARSLLDIQEESLCPIGGKNPSGPESESQRKGEGH